ncbi:flavodoxin-dependent (E)-4-hydroxy-3-methylbut-2-enyl-diphosphate synthase, partial [Streptomyces galilaeus]|uniref:flavodoxin-dependent (E)-4-hydroxy-3-methylbut-2-enyl-diphosphate synthase n=1 Tax=Streptomyces galilaeus TaxID=33899 RepID=UPI0038F7E9FB
AAGIGTLLEDGIGDTIRVSLTEDPEFEIPVCRDLVKRYEGESLASLGKKEDSRPDTLGVVPMIERIPYDPFHYKR